MEKRTLICDTCNRDIQTSGNSIDYRLAVINQRIPSKGGVVTDMWEEPILERDYHFCSLSCFREWAKTI
jgi:hypothetical protein